MKCCFGIWPDSKNDAERHLEREIDDGSESPVVDICETSTNNAPRKRKKKSFGRDFEESTDPEDDIGESESMCHVTYYNIFQVWRHCPLKFCQELNMDNSLCHVIWHIILVSGHECYT